MDNTGLTKRNKIRKINWKAPNAWDGNPLFESEYDQPKKIQEVPGNSSYLYVCYFMLFVDRIIYTYIILN